MKLAKIIAAATTAAVLGTAGISIAGATSAPGSGSTPDSTASANAAAARRPGAAARVGRQALTLAAKTIGIDRAELVKELRAGKSIADVATAHNVTPQAVIDALVAAATTKINDAKAAGKLTDAQAAKLLDTLPERVAKLVNSTGREGRHARRRQIGRRAFQLAAKTIGIEPAELRSELRAGKTVADVATAHNVTPQTVIDALVAAATTKINDAKAAGKLTDAQAAKLLANLTERATTFVNDWHPKAK